MVASQESGKCWNCGHELGPLDYGRADTCKKCGRDTKTCRGCIFYDRSANNQCRESSADPVLDKERSNFCDYFKPSGTAPSQAAAARDAMRSAADALFKKKS